LLKKNRRKPFESVDYCLIVLLLPPPHAHTHKKTHTHTHTYHVLDFSHDVQIRQTRFHHQHVGSLPHVSLLETESTVRPSASAPTTPPTPPHRMPTDHSPEGESPRPGGQLVAPPVPECRCGLHGVSARQSTRIQPRDVSTDHGSVYTPKRSFLT